MLAKHISHLRIAGLLTGGTLALSGISYGADKTAGEADAFPVFDNNYIQVSAEGNHITGNKVDFQQKTQTEKTGFLGIEDMRYGADIDKDTSLQFDGKLLSGAEDYLGKMTLTQNEKGTVEAGYKRFRTFYDGVGGFFPGNAAWMPLPNPDLHVDRGTFWADVTINLPNAPVFKLSYNNELRSGRKDTTIWGGTDFTGLPNVISQNGKLLSISPTRKMVAGYNQLGERHQNLEGSMTHTVGNTTIVLRAFMEKVDNNDMRVVYNSPNEVKRYYSQPSSNTVIDPSIFNNQILYTQVDGISSKTYGASASTVTVISPKLSLRTGISYESVDADITGTRPLATMTPTPTGAVLVITNNQDSLAATSGVKEIAGNIALDWKATSDFDVKLAFKDEAEYSHAVGTYNSSAASGTPATTVTSTPNSEREALNNKVTTPVLDLRYTGIPTVALYADGSLRSGSGDERLLSGVTAANTLTGTFGKANNNTNQDNGDYKIGANWRQSSVFTLRGELFHKDHEYKAVGYAIDLGDNYILDSQFTGIKVTAVIKPMDTITSTTRYIYQTGRMQVTGYLPGYEKYDSMDAKNYTIGETIDWVPCTKFYAQANVNIVFNNINTVYPRAGVTAPTTSAAGYDTNNVLQNSLNNNITASVILGLVVSKDDDLQVQANSYHATNGNKALAPWTMPYGVSICEQSVTVGLKHKFSNKMVGEFKVGGFDCTNPTNGGLTDFHGFLGYVSLTQAF